MTLKELEEQLSRLSPDTLRRQKEWALSKIGKYVEEFVRDFLSTETGVRIEAITPSTPYFHTEEVQSFFRPEKTRQRLLQLRDRIPPEFHNYVDYYDMERIHYRVTFWTKVVVRLPIPGNGSSESTEEVTCYVAVEGKALLRIDILAPQFVELIKVTAEQLQTESEWHHLTLVITPEEPIHTIMEKPERGGQVVIGDTPTFPYKQALAAQNRTEGIHVAAQFAAIPHLAAALRVWCIEFYRYIVEGIGKLWDKSLDRDFVLAKPSFYTHPFRLAFATEGVIRLPTRLWFSFYLPFHYRTFRYPASPLSFWLIWEVEFSVNFSQQRQNYTLNAEIAASVHNGITTNIERVSASGQPAPTLPEVVVNFLQENPPKKLIPPTRLRHIVSEIVRIGREHLEKVIEKKAEENRLTEEHLGSTEKPEIWKVGIHLVRPTLDIALSLAKALEVFGIKEHTVGNYADLDWKVNTNTPTITPQHEYMHLSAEVEVEVSISPPTKGVRREGTVKLKVTTNAYLPLKSSVFPKYDVQIVGECHLGRKTIPLFVKTFGKEFTEQEAFLPYSHAMVFAKLMESLLSKRQRMSVFPQSIYYSRAVDVAEEIGRHISMVDLRPYKESLVESVKKAILGEWG